MRILVTGSQGLIGSALSHALSLLGISVHKIDCKVEPTHIDYGDILDEQLLSSRIEQVDGIVHLAAVSRVVFGEKNPDLCWKTNVDGTRNVLEAALASVKRPWVIYASSREVYGQQKHLPVKETASLNPVNIYGESKMEAEKQVQKASEKGLRTAILRFSNVYGSVHDHADRVVPAFCLAAVEGKEIRVEGKDHLFDFTYIDDVIQGILSLIHRLILNDDLLPPIHLTTGYASSLATIATIAKQACYYPLSIIEKAPRSFDVATFRGDPRRAASILNWTASVRIEVGMQRLINQYRLYQPQLCNQDRGNLIERTNTLQNISCTG